ncbi:Fic family protein [Parvimonas micra]
MRNFNYSKIKDKKWDSQILSLVTSIYKYKGKQELYLKQRPEELNKLIEVAKIQSTEASNEIEGIVTTSARLKKLVEEKTTPRNRNEEEIAGYRDVLNLIHENFDVISISKNYILQMHKIMFRYMDNPLAGNTKNIQNYITINYPNSKSEILFTPPSPFETPEALENICNEYNKVIGNFEIDPLLVIPYFIHDFLCIHPFNDGNGRLSRLLTTLLLYRSGFYVGKYISLEALIAKDKSAYYEALQKSGLNWHKEDEDILPFMKYLLVIILAGYKEFEDRFSIVEEKLPAIELVRKAISQKMGRFTKQDIIELCPTLSLSSIEGSLRKLVDEGEIQREGIGRATKYIRLK